MKFDNIKNIDKLSYEQLNESIFLTSDIDWCSDEVLSFMLDIVEKYNVKITFFITHDTPLLARMRNNPNIELGIHPNFNLLLNGNTKYGKTFREVIDFYLALVPDAVSVRSHSLTQNSRILADLSLRGLKFECNSYIPFFNDIVLKPFKGCSELTSVPHFWEDDFDCERGLKTDLIFGKEGLKCLDFHPIHIFLNIENIKRYEKIKQFHLDFKRIQKYRYKGYGVNSFLLDLIKKVENQL